MFKRIFSADYRTALAAEAAGHLSQAAEHYAMAGEHADAARVHLARADRAPSRTERIAALRDALHWADSDVQLGRRIRKNLGRALIEQLRAEGVATERDKERMREAADMLEKGGDFAAAGEAYESIDDVKRAAASYRQGGLVDRLEDVLSKEEHENERARALRQGFADYEMHMRIGERDAARAALRACLEAADKQTEYRRLLDDLESRLITGSAVTLHCRGGPVMTALARGSLVIGRDNLCDLPLRAGGISRHHAEITMADAGTRPRFHVGDAGSKNGTLMAGLPIAGVVPLVDTGHLSLGDHCTIQYHVHARMHDPLPGEHLMLRVTTGMDSGRCAIAGGEGEPLDLEPLCQLNIAIAFRNGRPFLVRGADQVRVTLHGHAIAQGEVQLIHGDELRIDGVEVEVL